MPNENLIRKNRVFILGAGFSVGAGIPLTKQLLEKTLEIFANESPGIYSRLEQHAIVALGSKSEYLDLSELKFSELGTFLEFNELREYGGGERWSEYGSREKLALRFYLAKTLI